MRSNWLGAACGALLALASAAAHALPIAITSHVRSVAAEGSSDAGASADFDEALALGPATLDALAPPAGQGVWAVGRATLEGEVSTARITAVAEALSFATARPGELRLASAEALQRVEFTPSVDVTLRLSGALAWGAEGASDAVAFVELASVDTTLDPLLLRFALDGPDTALLFEEVATLRAGVAYALVGFVRTGADALGDESANGNGSFSFELAEVPEPGTLALVAAGLALLARRRS